MSESVGICVIIRASARQDLVRAIRAQSVRAIRRWGEELP